MSQLEPLIADLALILICAGVMTLLFKSLKQPIVLGYIVAGFLASPNMTFMPSITDGHGILRQALGAAFIAYIIGNTMPKLGLYGIFAVIAVTLYILLLPKYERRSNQLIQTFTENLNAKK